MYIDVPKNQREREFSEQTSLLYCLKRQQKQLRTCGTGLRERAWERVRARNTEAGPRRQRSGFQEIQEGHNVTTRERESRAERLNSCLKGDKEPKHRQKEGKWTVDCSHAAEIETSLIWLDRLLQVTNMTFQLLDADLHKSACFWDSHRWGGTLQLSRSIPR